MKLMELMPVVQGSQGRSGGEIKARTVFPRYVKDNIKHKQLEKKYDFSSWDDAFGVMSGYEFIEMIFKQPKKYKVDGNTLTYIAGGYNAISNGLASYYKFLSDLKAGKLKDFEKKLPTWKIVI